LKATVAVALCDKVLKKHRSPPLVFEYDIMRKGATRVVLLTKKYAIKFPRFYGWEHFLRGLLANMQEVEFNTMKDERLCPVKFYIPGGWLLVMPRCTPITEQTFLNLDIARFWPNESEDYHPDNECDPRGFNAPVENKQDSFGWYNGEIVAIDYGS
jgi:hypothetical protein